MSKAQDTTEFQWLLRSKGMEEIEKRRKFLLGGEADSSSTAATRPAASAKAEGAPAGSGDADQDMEDELAAELQQDDFIGETIAYI